MYSHAKHAYLEVISTMLFPGMYHRTRLTLQVSVLKMALLISPVILSSLKKDGKPIMPKKEA